MKSKVNGRTTKTYLQVSCIPEIEDEIRRELGSEQSCKIILTPMPMLRYGKKYKRLYEFSVRLFKHIGVSFGYKNGVSY